MDASETQVNGVPKTFTEFEDVLKLVGDYGRYQKKMILFFLVPMSFILPFFCMNIIFIMSVPDHWCHEPRFDHLNLTMEEKQELLRPNHLADGKLVPSKCEMYNYTDLLVTGNATNFQWLKNSSGMLPTQKCDHGWDFDKSLYDSSASTKWDLFCENDHLPTLVFTMGSVGSAIGTPIYGALSDKFGRKPIFMLTLLIGVLTSGLTVLVPTFLIFIIVRTINGSAMPCAYQLPYLILLEVVAPEMRARINGISCLVWTFGLAFMPLLAYLSTNWKIFGWLCFAALAPTIVYFWYLPESARWLISQKRYNEAAESLKAVAKENGIHLPDGYIVSAVKKLGEFNEMSSGKETDSSSPMNLIKYPVIRKSFLIICMSWIANSVAYYAFHINVTNLSGNEYMNFFFLAIVEFPSYLVAWFVLQTPLGRRWCNVMFTLLMAVACFTPAIVPSEMREIAVIASVIGKFGNCASFLAMYQQASELLPTAVRASGMGIAATLSSVVSICTPYIIYLGEYGKWIPFLMIACIALLAGILASFLPETLNESLPQTIHDGEAFATKFKFFSLAKTTSRLKEKQADDAKSSSITEMSQIDSINSSVK